MLMDIAKYVDLKPNTMTWNDFEECSLKKDIESTPEELADNFAYFYVMDECSKMESFCLTFGLDKEKIGRGDGARYNRVMNVVNRYFASNEVTRGVGKLQMRIHSEFSAQHIRALREQFSLGMTARSEKVRADALHQFIQNTRNPYLPSASNEDMQQARNNRQLLDAISQAFNKVTGNKEYVDAELVNPPSGLLGEEKASNEIFINSQNPKKKT
jgi:hypothetical protein